MTAQRSAVRLVIVDDQTLFRVGLAQLLNEDSRIEVIGQAENGAGAVDIVEHLEPDVVLMDLAMPQMDGIEATRLILALRPGIRVLILTTFDADSNIIEAMQAGSAGFVLKDSKAESIVSSIVAVADGQRVISGAIARRLLDMHGRLIPDTGHGDGLTPREFEILRLIAGRLSNKEIAHRLQISERTVRNHVSNIYGKLHVYSRTQAFVYAMRTGLVRT